jgi:hypothetical protein
MSDNLKRDSFLWTSRTDKDQTVKVFSVEYSKVGGSNFLSEMSVGNYQSPERNIPEHFDSHQQSCVNLTPHVTKLLIFNKPYLINY